MENVTVKMCIRDSQKAAQLHDERHLTRRKILADDDRRDERDGHQHVSLDVKCGDQPDDGLQNDGHSAQENLSLIHI